MVAVPGDTPDTIPVNEPIVATAVFPLAHLPPGVASVKVDGIPTHTLVEPVMAAGNGLTVSVATAKQPVAKRYVIIDVPCETPETTPDKEPTVATPVWLLIHVPPGVVLVRINDDPTQTGETPPMAAGTGLTVKVTVRLQPVARA